MELINNTVREIILALVPFFKNKILNFATR